MQTRSASNDCALAQKSPRVHNAILADKRIMLLTLTHETYETFYALDSFRHYWLETEGLIEKAANAEVLANWPKWSPKNEEEEAEFHHECREARMLHDEVMTPLFRNSCLVLLYSIVERELRRLLDTLEQKKGPPKLKLKELKGQFLEQARKYAEAFYDLSISQCANFTAVTDLQKIRDCIVHCRGELSLVNPNDREYFLTKLHKVRPGFFAWDVSLSIEIESICVATFLKEVWWFFESVFSSLGWKIDESWQRTTWPKE